MKSGELFWFAVKAETKERPFTVVSLIFVVSLTCAAFILRAAELPADGSDVGWIYYWNSLWCTFITITSGK